ncbi:hypothetical protein LCM00_20685 [Bacillus infantis]|uniref:hypothetical protein n=1 Tax=Bacillus infantis TaxID=324767 RepID=UPI001CD5AC28|nr:hypothetical protein [Bacillus infantis]MCA1041917.1 hypothetical protein [Bacillus infantis]
MPKNIKKELEDSIPDHITMSGRQKRTILTEAAKRLERKPRRSSRLILPLVSAAAILGLSGILAAPYVQEQLEENEVRQQLDDSLEKVTVPDASYPSLINSQYIGDTKELVYTDGKGFYSFNKETKTTETLVKPEEGAGLYEFAVDAHWLVWDSGVKGYALNRQTQEMEEIPNELFGDYQVYGNLLSYLSVGTDDQFTGYKLLDLLTLKESNLHELTGEGTNSQTSLDDGHIVIPETIVGDGEKSILFTLYDLKSGEEKREFTVPYDRAVNVTLTDEKIYAELYNDEGPPVLAYISLDDGKLHKVKTPTFDAYAVYEDYLALSIPEKEDSNSVKLYRVIDNRAAALPSFEHVEERLVKPRFTDDGVLVVNGEGEDFSMYLLDTGKVEANGN